MASAVAMAPIEVPAGISWRCCVELLMRRQKMLQGPEIIRAVRRGTTTVYWLRGESGVWPIVVKTVDILKGDVSLNR